MRVLVTGASGHIGRTVCGRLLAQGHAVNALVLPGTMRTPPAHPRLRLYQGNTEVAESLRAPMASSDVVIHAAGIRHAGRESTYEARNVEGTRTLARVAAESDIQHLIMVSSLAAQGPSEYGAPHCRAENEAPCSAYGRSLLAAEVAAQRSDIQGRLTILRPSMVYGSNDAELLPWAKMLRRGVFPLREQCEVSFLHVSDLADLIVQRVTAPAVMGPFLLSEGDPLQLAEVADLLEAAVGGPASLRLYFPRRVVQGAAKALRRVTQHSGLFAPLTDAVGALDAGSWACDAAEAHEHLAFTPKVNFQTGLLETIRAYRTRGLL